MYRDCPPGDNDCIQCQQVPDGSFAANPRIPWTKCRTSFGIAGVCKKNGNKFQCNDQGTNDCAQDENNGMPCACNLPPYIGQNGYCSNSKPLCKIGETTCKTVSCLTDGTTNEQPCDCKNPTEFGFCKFRTTECWQFGSAVKCN